MVILSGHHKADEASIEVQVVMNAIEWKPSHRTTTGIEWISFVWVFQRWDGKVGKPVLFDDSPVSFVKLAAILWCVFVKRYAID